MNNVPRQPNIINANPVTPIDQWETLQSAARRTGYAYNTFKRYRYLGILPFPVYEDRIFPGQRPKLTVKIADVNAWKARGRLPSGI